MTTGRIARGSVPSGPTGPSGGDRPPAATSRLVLATADPVFAAQCQKALDGSNLQLLATVALAELVDATRRLAPDLVVLDADREDIAAIKMLATKVMLVSCARIVLVSAYLAPGSPLLCALLQSVAASFVQKSRGPSWLGLPEDDRAAFIAALNAAFAAAVGGPSAGPPGGGAAGDRAPREREAVDGGWAAGVPPRSRP